MILKTKKSGLFSGTQVTVEAGQMIFDYRNAVDANAVYYISAGMVRLEYNMTGDKYWKHYLQPGAVFGLEEAVESQVRLSRAVAMEKTLLYKWNLDSFFTNAEYSRELALLAIKSLSYLIRIFNAEYGEQLAINRSIIDSTKEENRLANIDWEKETPFNAEVHHYLRQSFQDKQLLIKEGEIQKQVFWILNGEVYITKFMNGQHKIIAVLGKGELIGEMSFFDRSLTSASVIANGPLQVMVFSKKDFREIFFTNPKWMKQLLLSLSKRIVLMVRKYYTLR